MHSVLAYPSPARRKAVIGFNVSGSVQSAKVKIYSLSGEEVYEAIPSPLYPGFYNEVEWKLENSRNNKVASGLYIIKVEVTTADGTFFATNKMGVVKE